MFEAHPQYSTFQSFVSFCDGMAFRGLAVPRFFIHSSTDGPLGCFQGVFGKDLRGLTKGLQGLGRVPLWPRAPGKAGQRAQWL